MGGLGSDSIVLIGKTTFCCVLSFVTLFLDWAVVVCICVHSGIFPSVHRDCPVTVTTWLLLEKICHHVSHTASTHRLPTDWIVGSLEWREMFIHLQVTWTVNGTGYRLVLADPLVSRGFGPTCQRLLQLVLQQHGQLSDSHTQSHLVIPVCTIHRTLLCRHRQTLITRSYLKFESLLSSIILQLIFFLSSDLLVILCLTVLILCNYQGI